MTCIPFITEEFFATKEDFLKAVAERGPEGVRIVGETPFSQSLGVQTVADLEHIPCHVINSDPILSARHQWTALIKDHGNGRYTMAAAKE